MPAAFSSSAYGDLYPGILAANSREDERYFAVWPCKPMDVKYKNGSDNIGRAGYAAIGSEDGSEIVLDSMVSDSVEFGGVAANQVTGNFIYMFAFRNSQDSKLELFTGTISKSLELIDPDSVGIISEPIYSMGFGVTDFGTKLVCYSITEDGTAKTYVKIIN